VIADLWMQFIQPRETCKKLIQALAMAGEN